MLYLNNELLTSDRIVVYFAKKLALLMKVPAEGKAPSQLSQLKNKLKANFFMNGLAVI